MESKTSSLEGYKQNDDEVREQSQRKTTKRLRGHQRGDFFIRKAYGILVKYNKIKQKKCDGAFNQRL